jgi:type VI secretion system protein ImpG
MEAQMLERYYREELAHLRELAAEFAAAHPALAPMLAAGSTDPDVERLLEGVAFQTGLLRRKLDDDFPELVHDLARIVSPQYLRPVPASTIVAFTPKPSLTGAETIPAGTRLASVPVDGTRCLFRTCAAVELHPLELTNATFQQPAGEAPAITLSFTLKGMPLENWSPRALRLFLAGDYAAAADLYLLLRRHLQRIIVTPDTGGNAAVIPPEALQPAGFAADEAVIPYPPQVHPGYRFLQEYFTMPQRFLFLDIVGWERWVNRGNGSAFSIRFQLPPLPLPPPTVKKESFVLFATPAVNLFSHDAVPVQLDHRRERYLIRPEALPADHAQIFSVDSVTGLASGRQREYLPFERFRKVTAEQPAYHTTTTASPISRGFDVHLSVAYPKGEGLPEAETLSITLTCSNGRLPEALRPGDLCQGTDTSPESATFRNITPITPTSMPFLGKDLLWRLLSHLSLNHLSIANAESLRALLFLYLSDGNSNAPMLVANRNRVEGIEEVRSLPAEMLVRGIPVRGTEISLQVRGDNFPGEGDLFLFGSVLDEFLSGYASINSFTRLIFQEATKGEKIRWQPRLGKQILL